ncbi:MAG TPA: transglycosylase domain-containing protein [Gaiellaceae bacterium]|nr:transglycosylase domain-containing protein [Gaiellaceae bacterium]
MTGLDPIEAVVEARRGRRRRGKRPRRLLLLTLLLVVGSAVVVAAAAGGARWYLSRCTLDGRTAAPLGRTSVVYAADGTYLGAIHADTYRRVVPDSRISPWLKKATVAIEDRRFWTNPGVDYRGLARAAVQDVLAGHIVQGGSTITQQLVRSMYLDDSRTFARKRLEACLALKLTRRWPKERILTTYLNRAPYGHRAYGVEAAAWTYFDRPAAKLGPAQAALIAGLPQAPSRYDPLVHPAQALARRNEVLRALVGAGALTRARYRRLVARPLGLHPGRVYTLRRAPTFFSYVRSELVRVYGEQRVRQGGLRVYTTLVPRDQRAARSAIRSVLNRKHDPAGAVASVDPRTGAIRALVGVVHGRRLDFDLAVSGRRQAGSAFKTFVLAAAIARGANPYSTKYLSAPFSVALANGTTWRPHTYENAFFGVENLVRATLLSDNVVYAKLTLDVGAQHVAQMAHRLGVRSPLDPVASIGLGADAVSPLDMASAYATLAAGGVYRAPHAIRKVVLPDGAVDTSHRWTAPPKHAVPRNVAYWVTRVLQANVERGTGTAARLPRRAVAGKTGTTSDWTDGWFVGYTRRLAAAAWVGYPHRTVPMTDVHGIHVTGGSLPAQIWARYAKASLRGKPAAGWLQPLRPMRWRPWHGERRYVPRRPKAKPGSYVLVLSSFRPTHLHEAQSRAHAIGAKVTRSGRIPGLRPGWVVVYAGPFATESAARAARDRFARGIVR